MIRKKPKTSSLKDSNIYRKSNGGPWQALEKGADLFVYWFPRNKYLYVFKTRKLVDFLESIVSNYKLINVYNDGWITAGYKINRTKLESVILQEKDVNVR